MEYLKQNILIHHFNWQIGQKYNSQQKNYLSENLWLNTGENQKIPILLKSYLLIFTQLKYLCKLLSTF